MLFLIISVVVYNLIAILIPKRLTKIEMYGTSLFGLYFALITDVYLDLKHNLYGYFTKGVDYKSLIAIFGLYPSVNIIFLNYFPFRKGIKAKIIYILGWSMLLIIYEWVSLIAGYFYHNEWKLWYSALLYPLILSILVLNLLFIRAKLSN
jgi:hypothetical protein